MAPIRTPGIRALRVAVARFRGTAEVLSETPSCLAGCVSESLSPERCRDALVWLNSWGCRIQYPREEDVDLFGTGLQDWWNAYRTDLPSPKVALASLTNRDIANAQRAYMALRGLRVGRPERPRRLGSTAATKLLHALRPPALMPWDDAIAQALHGAQEGDAYAGHLSLGRRWARDLLRRSDLDEAGLSTRLGCPGRPLSKILDDYCYLRFTRGEDL